MTFGGASSTPNMVCASNDRQTSFCPTCFFSLLCLRHSVRIYRCDRLGWMNVPYISYTQLRKKTPHFISMYIFSQNKCLSVKHVILFGHRVSFHSSSRAYLFMTNYRRRNPATKRIHNNKRPTKCYFAVLGCCHNYDMSMYLRIQKQMNYYYYHYYSSVDRYRQKQLKKILQIEKFWHYTNIYQLVSFVSNARTVHSPRNSNRNSTDWWQPI